MERLALSMNFWLKKNEAVGKCRGCNCELQPTQELDPVWNMMRWVRRLWCWPCGFGNMLKEVYAPGLESQLKENSWLDKQLKPSHREDTVKFGKLT
jgi:hypothetical protein